MDNKELLRDMPSPGGCVAKIIIGGITTSSARARKYYGILLSVAACMELIGKRGELTSLEADLLAHYQKVAGHPYGDEDG